MTFSGPFLLFYSPFVVAAIVLIWANISRKNVENVVVIEEQNNLLDRTDMTLCNRSA